MFSRKVKDEENYTKKVSIDRKSLEIDVKPNYVNIKIFTRGHLRV